MSPLEPPDIHYLRAAVGWIELGNVQEAEAELSHITAGLQQHPAVLETKWQICERRKDWEQALQIARSLMTVAPEQPFGWIHQAYSLRRLPQGGLQVAWDALLPAAEKFPQEPIIPYNLACYAAQQGRVEDAWHWLNRAMKLSQGSVIRKMALADPDLEPLWDRLRHSEG